MQAGDADSLPSDHVELSPETRHDCLIEDQIQHRYRHVLPLAAGETERQKRGAKAKCHLSMEMLLLQTKRPKYQPATSLVHLCLYDSGYIICIGSETHTKSYSGRNKP